MIKDGSLVYIKGNGEIVYEVMSIDVRESHEWDLVWLKWAQNKDYPDNEGVALSSGVYRKHLIEITK